MQFWHGYEFNMCVAAQLHVLLLGVPVNWASGHNLEGMLRDVSEKNEKWKQSVTRGCWICIPFICMNIMGQNPSVVP